MKRVTKIALIAALSVGLVVISSVIYFTSNEIFAQEETSNYSLDKINSIRARSGLKKLSWNSKLEKAAESKANDMVQNGYFDHTSPSGTKAWNFILDSGYSYRFAGENLAVDYNSVDDAFVAWQKSPSHLENILSNKFTDYALVEREGVISGENVKIYVQLFGSL